MKGHKNVSVNSITMKTFHNNNSEEYNKHIPGVRVLKATFNNISVISWRSVLSVEETGVSGKIHQPVANH